MGAMLEVLKDMVLQLDDDSLCLLASHVNVTLRDRRVAGREDITPSLESAMAAGKSVASRKMDGKEIWWVVSGIDLEVLKEGKGFYAVGRRFAKPDEYYQAGYMILRKNADGTYELFNNKYLGMMKPPTPAMNWGPSFAKVKEHRWAEIFWEIAFYFCNGEMTKLEN